MSRPLAARARGGRVVRLRAAALIAGGLLLPAGPARAQLPVLALPDGPADEAAAGVADWAQWAEEEGGLERVRIAIMTEIARSSAAEGTLWAALLTVLEQVEGPASAEAIRAVGLAIEAEGLAAADRIMEALPGAGPEGRAALLALAAHLAEREDQARAAELRGALLRSHPEAPEATEARLLLAVWLLRTEGREAEALALLEALITGAPTHPLAPEARRLFEANRAAGPGAPAAGAR